MNMALQQMYGVYTISIVIGWPYSHFGCNATCLDWLIMFDMTIKEMNMSIMTKKITT
jgi:hypothetical protein